MEDLDYVEKVFDAELVRPPRSLRCLIAEIPGPNGASERHEHVVNLLLPRPGLLSCRDFRDAQDREPSPIR